MSTAKQNGLCHYSIICLVQRVLVYISAAVISSQLKSSHAGSYVKMESISNILGTVTVAIVKIFLWSVARDCMIIERETLLKIEIHSILS